MSSINEMEEFVNWDNAAASVGTGFDMSFQDINADPNHPIDLVLENVNDDDFGFFALQHFAGEGDAVFPASDVTAPLLWETPEAPCTNCTLGGYQCKRIAEGQYKGYCTSCVALRVGCSLPGPMLESINLASASFPQNPWPTLGEHPNSIPHEDLDHASIQSISAPDLPSLAASSDEHLAATSAGTPPKIGARFSRESVRILKNWLSTHNRHPYPSEEEKEMLQRQTGLNKTQITNWLANARRRGKIQPPRSTSPVVRSRWIGPMDIPKRRGTPALENMNPLQRWVDSPPEHEPASVTAIARAVASGSTVSNSSGLNSPRSLNFTDDGSSKSICNASTASSLNTSNSSGGSFASAFSHASRGSFGSFGSYNRGRRRRRRRAAPKGPEEKTSLSAPLKTFQCTFCTETFRTKHDWQRHEKSLHLSLERWVCAPDGPQAPHPETNLLSCVFCGAANPDEAHIESHNHSACLERTLEERTFYRKDHLNQHLRLVHNVKFVDWSMKPWKVATPEIRSRCGFCGIVMDTWTIRVDHLAEHFKTGNTMADWKGDWGFEAPVLDMVENSIPPYLIDTERNSPLPYEASGSPVESPRSAYELIKMELAYFIANHQEKSGGSFPDYERVQLEACRIIFASEVLSLQGISSTFSWLRDLIMSSTRLARDAQLGPIRSQIENRLSILKINGKDNLFEQCPLEHQLHEFVRAKRLLGLTAMDDELQAEACRIVGRIEEVSTTPSDFIANWLVKLVYSSTGWLANFRQRAHLPRTEDIECAHLRSTDASKIDSTIHNYSRLERELGEYIDLLKAHDITPSDSDLQRQARIIIYEFDDGWNQTAADNQDWLTAFKQRHEEKDKISPPVSGSSTSPTTLQSAREQLVPSAGGSDSSPSHSSGAGSTNCRGEVVHPSTRIPFTKTSPFFLNDANCYRRLARELGRYAAATMSPNNPQQHVPTDTELQHHARWILYDDDDPWNQTAADNAEWLQRFKRDYGVVKDDGPGLPAGDSWATKQGGTGFAPPYAFPKSQMAPVTEKMELSLCAGAKPWEAEPAVANKFLETFTTRYDKPATVFCSRELEAGLVCYVQRQVTDTGVMPDDLAIRRKARQILDDPTTAADDPVLLAKFKKWMGEKLGISQTPAVEEPSVLPVDMDMNMSDAEMNNILQDMNFEFDAADMLDIGMEVNTSPNQTS